MPSIVIHRKIRIFNRNFQIIIIQVPRVKRKRRSFDQPCRNTRATENTREVTSYSITVFRTFFNDLFFSITLFLLFHLLLCLRASRFFRISLLHSYDSPLLAPDDGTRAHTHTHTYTYTNTRARNRVVYLCTIRERRRKLTVYRATIFDAIVLDFFSSSRFHAFQERETFDVFFRKPVRRSRLYLRTSVRQS